MREEITNAQISFPYLGTNCSNQVEILTVKQSRKFVISKNGADIRMLEKEAIETEETHKGLYEIKRRRRTKYATEK